MWRTGTLKHYCWETVIWKKMMVSQKLSRITIWSSNSTSGYIFKKIKEWSQIFAHVFFVFPPSWWHHTTQLAGSWFPNQGSNPRPPPVEGSTEDSTHWAQGDSPYLWSQQHFSQKPKGGSHLSVHRWMNAYTNVHTYHEGLFSLKKEENSDTCYSMQHRCTLRTLY